MVSSLGLLVVLLVVCFFFCTTTPGIRCQWQKNICFRATRENIRDSRFELDDSLLIHNPI